MSETAHRILKNTGFLYAKMGITMFISLYTSRLILNTLGASDFGIFNIVGGAIAMLGFLNASMAGATQRFMSYCEGEGNKDKQKSIFNISFVLHIVIALILGLVLVIAGYFFFNGILNIEPERIFAAKVVYLSLVISTIFTVLTVPYDAVLNAHENMLYYSIVGIIESLLKLTVAFYVVWYGGDKLVIYGVLMAIIPMITMTIMRIYSHNKYEECTIAPRKYWDKALVKELTGFAGWNFLSSASGMISQYGLGIVLNNFFGTILNASQGIANQISGQLMVFSNTMMKAVNPIITKREGNGNRNSALSITLISSKYSFLILVFFSIPLLIETPYILHIWLGNVPDWAVVFTRLQLSRSLIEQLTVMLGVAISAKGEIKLFSIIRSILNSLPIVLTFICFRYGLKPYWLYIVWIFAGGILGGGVLLLFTIKKCGLSLVDYYKVVFLPSFTITIIMIVISLIPYYYLEISWLRLFLIILLSSVSFIVSLIYLILNKNEKIFIISQIKSLKAKLLSV